MACQTPTLQVASLGDTPKTPKDDSRKICLRIFFREVVFVVIFLTGEMNPPLKISACIVKL